MLVVEVNSASNSLGQSEARGLGHMVSQFCPLFGGDVFGGQGVFRSDFGEWSQIFFHLSISSCRTWTVLWFLLFHTYLNDWGSNFISSNSYGFFRICITLRSNILLRGDGNHKSFLCYPLYRGRPGSMNMRRICGR